MSRVEQLKERMIDMIDKGCTGFGFTVGPAWHSMTIEQKANCILEVWDAPKVGDSKPPHSGRPSLDLRELTSQIRG